MPQVTIKGEDFLLTLYQKFNDGQTDDQIAEWWESIQDKEYQFKLSKTQKQKLREDFEAALRNGRHEKALKLQQWYKENPHLPQPSIGMIHKFLWGAKDNEEQCKKLFHRYFSLRGTDDDIFGQRDPCSQAAMDFYKISNYTCIPTMTNEMYRISISVLSNYDHDKFSPKEWVRRIFHIADLRVRDDFCLGDIMIYDLVGFSVQHLVKFQIGLVKKMILAAEGGLPTRIKQIHLLNSPTFIDKITSFFRPFLKDKMAERVVIHNEGQGYEKLYTYIPKENLPEEYGGTAGKLSDHCALWIKEFEDNRVWFDTEEKNIKRIYLEGQKNGKIFVDSGELFGVDGSFKQLSID